ncbi:MAG: leucine-rich repeat domain-containing protein [Phycisphaerae bacterium]|nr:leucine-rich repeat domain-containing protein [Saprospiraceae bacterium]
MKAPLFLSLCLLCLSSRTLSAQNQQEAGCSDCPQYDAFMEQGRIFLKGEIFDKALTEFQAAQVAARICKCNSTAPSDSILKVFKGIQRQKDVAIAAQAAAIVAQKRAEKAEKTAKAEKAKTQQALAETEKAKNEAQTALQKADKLIKAFYFYADRFALAYGEKNGANAFYFIDKNGDEVPKLGQWKKAEQFDFRGFAKVKKQGKEEGDFLLDTMGNAYPAAFDIKDLKPEIRALDLSGKKLTEVPEEVFQYLQLEVLSLNTNSLDSLSAQIGELKNLKYLDLSLNQLTSLPAQIGKLKHLTYLGLGYNQLTSLPAQIGGLKNLISLDLIGNQLTNLPDQILELKNLTSLDLSENQLTSLPAQIGELKNLTHLNLYFNQLTSLPEQIWGLMNLTDLDLSGNQLTSLPAQIWGLKNLTTLGLGLSQLTSLPAQIVDLKNLTSLSLFGNQLTSLSAQIGDLKNLTDLNLHSNQLTSLPAQIGDLKNLTSLSLFGNQLTSLPAQIGELKNLTSLELWDNKLTTLPEQIGELKNLTSLELWDNQLTSLPEQIGELKNLKILKLGYNPFTDEALEQIKLLLPTCIIGGFTDEELASENFSKQNYPKAYDYIKNALEKDSANYQHWSLLSFYALFVNQPQEAISAAQKTLELDPESQQVESYLALGYLLNNQWSEAEKIYLKWKGQKFPDDERLCDDVFLQDIQDLEAAGITHPDFEKVKQLFKQ